MFQAICKIVAPIASLLGIASAEHEWKWSGQPGTPRWELLFDFDGFQYAAELAPSNGRPANIGRFSDYPCVNSMEMASGVHYVPTRHKAIVLQDFIDSGMSAFQADRAYRKLLRHEMTATDEYDRGMWTTYRMVVSIKRGRSELATDTIDGINTDPSVLMFGGELHVTEAALGLRDSLRQAAIDKLKFMSNMSVTFS